MNTKTRSRCLAARLSAEEYERVQRLAGARPMTSEWLRGFLLDRVRRLDENEGVLAEVMALRAIVLSTLAEFKPDAVEHIREFSDKDKRAKAQRVLQAAPEAR